MFIGEKEFSSEFHRLGLTGLWALEPRYHIVVTFFFWSGPSQSVYNREPQREKLKANFAFSSKSLVVTAATKQLFV